MYEEKDIENIWLASRSLLFWRKLRTFHKQSTKQKLSLTPEANPTLHSQGTYWIRKNDKCYYNNFHHCTHCIQSSRHHLLNRKEIIFKNYSINIKLNISGQSILKVLEEWWSATTHKINSPVKGADYKSTIVFIFIKKNLRHIYRCICPEVFKLMQRQFIVIYLLSWTHGFYIRKSIFGNTLPYLLF